MNHSLEVAKAKELSIHSNLVARLTSQVVACRNLNNGTSINQYRFSAVSTEPSTEAKSLARSALWCVCGINSDRE